MHKVNWAGTGVVLNLTRSRFQLQLSSLWTVNTQPLQADCKAMISHTQNSRACKVGVWHSLICCYKCTMDITK